MAMYGYVWLCVAVYGHVWLYSCVITGMCLIDNDKPLYDR